MNPKCFPNANKVVLIAYPNQTILLIESRVCLGHHHSSYLIKCNFMQFQEHLDEFISNNLCLIMFCKSYHAVMLM